MSSSADAPEWADETQPNYRDPEVARFTFPALMEASKGYAPWVDPDTRAMLEKISTSEPTLNINGHQHNLVSTQLDNE